MLPVVATAPITAADNETHGCEPGDSIRLRWRNSEAVRSKLRYFRRLVSAAVLALTGCVCQAPGAPINSGRTCACSVPPPCCALRPPRLRFAARRPWRGGSRRAERVGRPAGPRALKAPPRLLRCGAVPRPPAVLGSGIGGPPARLRAPGWGRGLSPFGALLRFVGALLPLFSSPPPPPVAVRLFSRFLYQSAYSHCPESKGIASRPSAVVAAAAAETVPLSRRGKTAQG